MNNQEFGPDLVGMATKQIMNNPKVKQSAKAAAALVRKANGIFSRLSEQDLVDYLNKQNADANDRYSPDEVKAAAKELHNLPEESKDLLTFLDEVAK